MALNKNANKTLKLDRLNETDEDRKKRLELLRNKLDDDAYMNKAIADIAESAANEWYKKYKK